MSETILITSDNEQLIYPSLANILFNSGYEIIIFSTEAIKQNKEYKYINRLSNLEKIPYLNAVINLAGQNINKRWSDDYKNTIYDSRIQSTLDIINHLRKFDRLPEVFINASSVKYYLGQQVKCYEDTPIPEIETFLGRVFTAWEDSAKSLLADNIRLCFARMGEILTPTKGILKNITPFFKNGLGAAYGHGNQVISWIHIEDCIQAILHLLNNSQLSGAFNLVAPSTCTNNEFSATLAAQFGKKTLYNMPDWMVWSLYGQMGYETLLQGVNAVPQRLHQSGFFFKYTDINGALQSMYN